MILYKLKGIPTFYLKEYVFWKVIRAESEAGLVFIRGTFD